MRRTSYYLTAALSLLLTGLLAGCGSAAPPPLETLSGEWVDAEARASVCGETYAMGVYMDLYLEDDHKSVSGEIILDYLYDGYPAFFLGQMTSTGRLTGSGEFYDYWGSLEIDLTFSHSGIAGTVTDVDATECSDGSLESVLIRVDLQRNEPSAPVEDDALEPNNSRDEAKEVAFDDQADLVLQDEDWFTFTLSDERLVSLEIGADNANYFHTFGTIYNALANKVADFEFDSSGSERNPGAVYLSAGTYYLKLTGSVESETRAYTLDLSSQALPDAALEPNNSADEATNVSANFSGDMFLTPDDEDWFSFTLSEDRLVTLEHGDNQGNTTRAFYNADLEAYRYVTKDADGDLTAALKAGKHYLRIYDESGSSRGFGYSLKVSSQPLPDALYEPNNSFDAATPVQLPFSADLYSFGANDEDWFTFTLPERRLVSLERGPNHPSLSGVLYKNNRKPFDHEFFLHTDHKVASFVLPAGTYYLALRGDYDSNRDFTYSVSITSKKVPDSEYEPNDTRDTAHVIKLGFSDNSLLVSEGDEDWFSFTLDRAQQVNITLEGASEHASFSAYLYDAGDINSGNLRSGLNSPFLAKGTHYLKVYTYNSAAYYRLSVAER